jgi:hypothetical protein
LLPTNGRQPLYVAEQLGHSPAVLHDTHADLFAEYADRRPVDPEGEIDRVQGASKLTGHCAACLVTLSSCKAVPPKGALSPIPGEVVGIDERSVSFASDGLEDRAALHRDV